MDVWEVREEITSVLIYHCRVRIVTNGELLSRAIGVIVYNVI